METLGELIDSVLSGMQADGLSPFPGFFTLVAIANVVISKGWVGKKRTSSGTQLTRRQMLAIKNYLDQYYEKKHHNGRTYYGRNKRY